MKKMNVAKEEENMMHVSISKGNIKMGAIQSVSLPAWVTCRKDAPCFKKCYAAKIERLRKTVKAAYINNLEVLEREPETYWREVEAAIMLSRFFRFHVSGDIPNADYLRKMVEIAARNPHCEILCFTKRYEIVNGELDSGMEIPDNLHLIFSAWPGLPMENPHSLPEAHVIFRDGTTTASDGAKWCGGNCTECAKSGEGCWTLHAGEQVLFAEH